jgi:hypothetical protein
MTELSAEIKEILARPKSDRFNKVAIVGYSALEEKDFKLANAAADHIISRAESGSGDLVRGLVLLSLISEAEGDMKKSSVIMASGTRKIPGGSGSRICPNKIPGLLD